MTRNQIADTATENLERMLDRCKLEAHHWKRLALGSELKDIYNTDFCRRSARRFDRLAGAIQEELDARLSLPTEETPS